MPKAIVACVYSLEVLQTCMSTVDSFRDFGTGWGNVAELDNVGLLWFSVPVLGSISEFIHHSILLEGSC